MNANPSPGNKAGGLTTILEKSLGAMAKAGSTNLVDVLHYAEPMTKKGFVFMDTPGYDPVAATGQVAGGANLVCFTTGRGSVFGCKPAPSIKLATNTPMYKRMEDDMDVNCGTILDGEETVQQCGQRIFELMLKTASGQPTKSESLISAAPSSRPGCLGRRCECAMRAWHLQRAEVTCRNVVAHLFRKVIVRVVESSRIYFSKYFEAWRCPTMSSTALIPAPRKASGWFPSFDGGAGL